MTAEERTKTQAFIDKYLVTGKPAKGLSYYGMMNDARGTRQKRVAYLIQKMDYGKVFMHTIYWQLVAEQVKRNSHWRCSITGRKGRLEVHHANYHGVHGYEMFHVSDGELICVCPEYHKIEHDRMEEARHRPAVGNEELCSFES